VVSNSKLYNSYHHKNYRKQLHLKKQGVNMTIQQVVAELENIKEQTLNNSKITLDDVIEAIEDVITDCKDNSMDFTFDLEDDYATYERETDFTQLEIS